MMKTAIVLGSSRSNGNTSALSLSLVNELNADYFDLNQFVIQPFAYDNNYQDDFAGLISRLLDYDRLIFASPMYWYSASGQMKIFFDRLSDLLSFRQEQGRRLRGKEVALIATGNDLVPADCFEQMFALSFNHLGMDYLGMLYCCCQHGFVLEQHQLAITEFIVDKRLC